MRASTASSPADGGEVAHPAQQPAGDPRRAAGAARDLPCPAGREREAEKPGGAADDALELRRRIEIEAQGNAEALAQGAW